MQRINDDNSVQEIDVQGLLSPEVIANPYPYYAKLREQPPQFGLKDFPPGTVPDQDQPHPAWALVKYQDVALAASDHESFSSRDPMQEASSAPTLMLVNHDRPRHTELRGIAQQAFTPKRIEQSLAGWVKETVVKMIADLPSGEIDFMTSFAPDLPARLMTRLIGTPEEDYVSLRRWSNAFMVTSDFTIEERNQCNQEIAAYYTDAVNQRYTDIEAGLETPDDLMTAFIKAEHEGSKLTREEVVRFCLTLVVAGAETTGYLLGNIVCTLAQEPEFFDLLKQDRHLIRPFIEESLRRDGPPQRLFRVAVKDTDIGGVTIKQGDWVALFYAAANRDPSVFEEPDRFVIGRSNINKQLTFGRGIHHCMGARIARLEAETMINCLLDSCSRIDLGSRPMVRQTGGLLNYGLDSCPVILVP
ncbi:biotin biosynthesis cytochrome P450 [Arenicella chitinivorans]|uniref:Biotin biosynthesis cytochrome P450 n=1 Tax=Arenicella chitinivorans TaxID=1329800 RepID=A0A918S2F6_9GAMM|nr:cytochrome P450 [Arenicella chitinivorans]GHA20641.1 biotin biosynthesis cytochrome P450 [Arenicella chitinivorans]